MRSRSRSHHNRQAAAGKAIRAGDDVLLLRGRDRGVGRHGDLVWRLAA